MSRNPSSKRVEKVFEYIKESIEHPEEHLEHWEDWLRAGRRRFLLLNIIYYIQHVQKKEDGVSKEDLEEFLRTLYHVDKEMFSNIIKPWKSLEDTLKELLERRLVVQTSKGKYLVNSERIKTEKDLIYWNSVKRIFDEINTQIGGDIRNE